MDGKSNNLSLEIRLFGGFDVRVGDNPLPALRSKREQWLFALLALRHRQDTARDWLATTLWADADESQALFYLRKSLSNLRAALGTQAERIVSPTPRTVRLNLTDAFADFAALEVAGANTHSPPEELEHIVGLYRGDLLPECQEEWIFPERERFIQIHLALLETLAQNAQSDGFPADAVRWLRRVIAADPYREYACQNLMQALADCGDLAAVTQVYRELRMKLHSDLNAMPSTETERLYQRLRENPVQAVVRTVAPSETASRRHLPVPLTDLLGREDEVEEIGGWLSRRRLVTLLGTGGIGKTRLAIASAESLLQRFPDGVWFVDFAGIADASQAAALVAKTLGIPDTATQSPEDVLAERLAAQTLLLVFDNCEHLLAAAAVLGFGLLSACANLRILATSRQALGVTGEQVLPIAPLAFPTSSVVSPGSATAAEKDPHVLMEYPAIQLFVERAVQSEPTFRLTRRNQNTVVSIVQELDGIPLAIEMAAARLRSFSLGEIETRLTARLQLLTTGNRGGRPRHQTLRAALDWSHDLLSDAEQTLLRRLSVFVGGWTLEAAEQVCLNGEQGTGNRGQDNAPIQNRKSKIENPNPSEVLAWLREKSLIVREAESEDARFRMLMTVREYAAERLEVSGERADIEQHHVRWFRQFVETIRNGLNHGSDKELMGQLDADYANVRAALEFARTYEQFEDGFQMLNFLDPYWIGRGMTREGLAQCRALLDAPSAKMATAERASAARAGAWMAHYQNHYEEAERYGMEARAIFHEIGDIKGECRAVNLLAAQAAEQNNLEMAQKWITECVVLTKQSGELLYLANVLNIQGEILQIAGDLVGAKQSILEGLSIRREHGTDYGVAASLYALGRVLYEEGDWAEAEACCRESLMLFQRTDAPLWESSMQIQLGWIALRQNRIDEGIAFCLAGLEAQRTIENAEFITSGLDALAEAACRLEQWERVARLHGASDKLRRESRCVVLPMQQADYERQKAAALNALGETAYHKFGAASSDLTLPQIFALAFETSRTNILVSDAPHGRG